MHYLRLTGITKEYQNREIIKNCFPANWDYKIRDIKNGSALISFQYPSFKVVCDYVASNSLMNGNIRVIKAKNPVRSQRIACNKDINDNFKVISKNELEYAFVDNGICENLHCIICYNIFSNPVRTKCNHYFCKDCIIHWSKKEKTCPICRKIIGKLEKDYIILNIIDNVSVYCSNNKEECTWIGRISDLDNHLKICEYQKVQCTIDPIACKWIGLKRNYEKHYNECTGISISCSNAKRGCDWYGKTKNLEKHLKKCPNHIIRCKNYKNGCQLVNQRHLIPKKHDLYCKYNLIYCSTCDYNVIKKHYDYEKNACYDCIVSCINSNKGCNVTLSKKDMINHRKTCDYRIVKCNNKDCIWKGSMKEWKEYHSIFCLYKTKSCNNCSWSGLEIYYTSHSKICVNKNNFQCPNCQWKGSIRDYKVHQHICSSKQNILDNKTNLKTYTQSNIPISTQNKGEHHNKSINTKNISSKHQNSKNTCITM